MDSPTKSRKTLCIEDLRQRILTQALEPGSYLDETDLAESYGISRPPLREILRQMAGEGYLVLHENRGAQVAPMTYKTMRNFFLAAPMIYAAVSRLAAENARPDQIALLKETQAAFRDAIRRGNPADRALMNERFHSIIGEMADNEYLTPSLRRLLIDHTRIGMTFYSPRFPGMTDVQSVAADQHDLFIERIEAGDADGAADLAVAHWELSRAQIESFVTPESIRRPLGRAPGA
ncbi:FCD domain-containing protein [Rhodobacter sphaeroides]|uniref:Transcriptional regulator, GntR family n=2 Tax=Cereibacter TaxID=1653176 RepID=Q3IVH1_CERS4|nr:MULTISPECIES: GntR family transcriptional regulator [Cereibacter]RDS96592.1 GntR family transcriptional regulator [Cereibacter sphaeroides f. sp. denitrificans]ABA81463.2 Transcriptional regulator, GntR family [Cereibacter sphaeroides 2.4.1]AMJ50021.1 GntR family transcriptional regulator [Cereibacter sphaeroides]ANS36799.1 GntR family transcriptional regulator [Cereibacter sphaeroides]ATN65808.1 GntR family transcriptional regulator [Cereibacter sphaeroides]